MTYKILHFSDLHLDTSFAGQGFPLEYGVERRLDLRACLIRIFSRARDLKVDAVTIGGDLYDQEYLLPETADFLQQQFSLLSPIRVIIAPGVKDPYTSDSPYARLNWSENVDIFYQRKLTCIDLSNDIHIWGACNPPPQGHSLFDDYKPADGVNILLLHGLKQSTNNNIYFFSKEVFDKSGMRIALLGGEHLGDMSNINQSGWIYPGTPEPLEKSEDIGLHQVVLLDIDGQNIKINSYDLHEWHYRIVKVDLTQYSSIAETANQITNLLEKENKKTPQSAFSIEINGSPFFDFNIRSLRELIQSDAYFRLECHTRMSYNTEQLAKEQTVRGLLVQHFLERIHKTTNDYERNCELTALNIALQALEGKQVNLYEIKEN